MSPAGRGEADGSLAALQAANERRTLEASSRNRKLAAAALMRLGADCPRIWRRSAPRSSSTRSIRGRRSAAGWACPGTR